MSLMMEARKVQKVGYSTLIVSLPKDWVEEVGLKQGDIVSFRRESDGGITVYPGLTKERESFRYIIDADLCDSPNLLTRIITANYLTGHDTIQIVSKKELSSRHLEEVRAVSRRLTGLGIVEQNLKSVTLQSFVDPTKFPIYGLMRRLQIILSSMLEQAVKSVVEGRVALADEVLHNARDQTGAGLAPGYQLALNPNAVTIGEKGANDARAFADENVARLQLKSEVAAVQLAAIHEQSFSTEIHPTIKIHRS